MNEIIDSLIVKYAPKTREIMDEYIHNNVQILISPLLYLLDSGVTEITPGNDLEYNFYNFTDTDGYVARLSKTLIPNYTFYKGDIDESNVKHLVFKSEVDQSIGNPGKYLIGVYEESSDMVSYTLSWYDVSEDSSIIPKSMFCVQDGKCYAVINHDASYNVICGNREFYVGIDTLPSEEKQGIERLLLQNYESINSQINVPVARVARAMSTSSNVPHNVRFDCSFVEKTIWQHNVDPQVSEVEEGLM